MIQTLLMVLIILRMLISPEDPKIPQKAKEALDKRFPGWRWSPVLPPDTVRYVDSTKRIPIVIKLNNVIKGDFDVDGKEDYAVKIIGPDSSKNDELVVALLSESEERMSAVIVLVSSVSPETYLALGVRGVSVEDLITSEKVIYPNDVIVYGYFEKAATAYIYEKGKFREITIAD